MKKLQTDETGKTDEKPPKSNSCFDWEKYCETLEKNPDVLQGVNPFELFGNHNIRSNRVQKAPKFVVENVTQIIKKESPPKIVKEKKKKLDQIEFGLRMKRQIRETGCTFEEAYLRISGGNKKSKKKPVREKKANREK